MFGHKHTNTKFNKNLQNNSFPQKNLIKKELFKKNIVIESYKNKSTRKTTGSVGRLFNKIFGKYSMVWRQREVPTISKESNLFTYITNSKIKPTYKLIFNKKIGESAYGKVFRLKINQNKDLVNKDLVYKSVCIDGIQEYKAFKFHYLLQKYLQFNKPDLSKYLCKLYEYGFVNKDKDYSNIYAIMDNCGIELLEYIITLKVNNLLTLKKIIEIMIECAKALQIIHNLDYVHFDIKPQNFLVIEEGESIYIKIIDFGCITKVDSFYKRITKYIQLNKSINYNGTIQYFIPEIAYNYLNPKKSKQITVNKKIDIFSLGCIFCILLIIFNYNDTFMYKYNNINNFYLNLFVCPLNIDGNIYKNLDKNLNNRANYLNYYKNDILKLKQRFKNEKNDIIDILAKMVNPDSNSRIKISELIDNLINI